jgi:hypothetical protein
LYKPTDHSLFQKKLVKPRREIRLQATAAQSTALFGLAEHWSPQLFRATACPFVPSGDTFML